MTTVINGSYPAVNSDSDATINGLTVGKGGGSDGNSTAVGAGAIGGTNTSGYTHAFGVNALNAITSGSSNNAFGWGSLQNTTTGSGNSAFGHAANRLNTTGGNNTSLGYNALYSNTTASNNTAVGYQAGYSVVSGSYNTFIGNQAGYLAAPTGTALNVAVGHQAGYNLTGTANTFLGNGSGSGMTSGSKNSILGSYSGNQGGLDIRTASNYIVLSDGDGNPRMYCDNNGGWTISGTAYTSYTPGITASSGSFNSVSASGSYKVIGKTCFVNMTINYPDRGTATGTLYATLPFTSAAKVQIGGYGMEVNVTGNMLKGYIPASSTQLQITTYANGSVLTSGYQPVMNVVYEIA